MGAGGLKVLLCVLQLVPEFCKSCHEQAQMEGASSLSEDMSLQISHSLKDMIEDYLSSYNMYEEQLKTTPSDLAVLPNFITHSNAII